MKRSLDSIHLWFPNIFEFKGGIQTYSAFLLQALQKLYPLSNYDVFLKHDVGFPSDHRLTRTQYHCSGSWPLSLRTLAFASQIMGCALWNPPDIVIASHLNFAIAAYWLKQLAGIHYWVVAHGVESWNIQCPRILSALEHADQILAVSHYTRNRLLKEQGFEPSKVVVLPNTFDNTQFQISPKPYSLLQRYRLKEEQPIILTVARLDTRERHKGYDQLIQALPQIIKKIPNVHYLLAGKGDDKQRIEQLVQSLNLQKYVTLTGFIPDCELCNYYNLCDVFAMPSKGEGFGIVYLEALACGKPTLGGNQDGAIDALCQGELGVLVDPDDISAIAETLIQILQGVYSHPILYQPEILREKVIERYGFERFQQTLSNYIGYSPA